MEQRNSKYEMGSLILGTGIPVLLAAVAVVLTRTGHLQHFYRMLWEIFQSREALRAYLEGWGVWAPLVFAAGLFNLGNFRNNEAVCHYISDFAS